MNALANSDVASSLRWDLLELQPPSGERLTARFAFPGRRDDVFVAVDASARRYLLVGIPVGEPNELAERVSRGIAVQTVEMKVGDGRTESFIEIACLEAQGYAALDTIAAEVLDAVEAGASIGRVRLVQSVLAKWRRFWSGVDQSLLSKEQQLGLFGELWFLSRWLRPYLVGVEAVKMWRGPTGARNDFECRGLGIEVKTTSRLDGSHVVHGLEQMLEPPGGALMLFSLTVRDEASGTESLPRIVQDVRAWLSEDYAALASFDSSLYASGYDDRWASEYGKVVLRVRSENLYRVGEGFPRLVPASIIGGLPAGLGAVTYELRLETAGPWLLASSPAAGKPLSCFMN